MTPQQKKFNNATLSEQVRIAMPIAQRMVLVGLQSLDATDSDEHNLMWFVDQLSAAPWPEADDEEGVMVTKAKNMAEVAFAIGVAAGLLLRPEAFAGGAR